MDHEDSWSSVFFANFALEVTNFKPWMWEKVIPRLTMEFLSKTHLTLHAWYLTHESAHQIMIDLPSFPFLSFIHQTPNPSLASYIPFTFCFAGPATFQQSLLLLSLHLIKLNIYFDICILKCLPFLLSHHVRAVAQVPVSHCLHVPGIAVWAFQAASHPSCGQSEDAHASSLPLQPWNWQPWWRLSLMLPHKG